MATVYAVNKTKLREAIGSNVIDSGENKAVKFYMYDTYEAAAVSADDIIEVCDKLPAGAMVTRIELITDDLGSGVTADVGDGDTVDRYIDGADVATAAALALFPSAAEIDNLGYKVGQATGDDQLQIKILGAAATGTIKIMVEYAL